MRAGLRTNFRGRISVPPLTKKSFGRAVPVSEQGDSWLPRKRVAEVLWTSLAWLFLGGLASYAISAVGLALVNTIGALAGFVAPNYRLWADNTFGAGADLYGLGLNTVPGAIMIALTVIVLRPKTAIKP